MSETEKIVTRIAPSPTGQMHIGTVRTALFNYLFAKQHQGSYFVRIEDTDRDRNKEEWVDAIWEDFTWCNLPPDKKFRQSEHIERHKELLTSLIASDKAYVSKEPKKDDPTQEVEVVRLKNPGTRVTFTDLIRGPVTFDTTDLGDFIIARSIDDPLYHFAVVVDDGDAGVTHVLRAEEHISNTPRQILILEALGFTRPHYAHFPLILAPDRSKLSKRKHGASIESYRTQGFIPEAILNYLALLGWNPGGEQEIFSLEELTTLFSLEKVHKSGAIFDIEKFRWFNQQHIERLQAQEFESRLRSFIESQGRAIPMHLTLAVAKELQHRSATLMEAEEHLHGEFSCLGSDFQHPSVELLLKGAKVEALEAKRHLEHSIKLLGAVTSFTKETVKESIYSYATAQGRSAVLWPMRTALSGMEKSPDPFTLSELLGKDETISRIEVASRVL